MAKKPAKKPQGGRPPVLVDPKVRAKLLASIRKYGTRIAGCARVNLSIRTLQYECVRDPEFAQEVSDAEMHARGMAESRLVDLSERDIKALTFLLERKWWKAWSKRNPDAISFSNIIRWASGLGQRLAKELPLAPEHRDKPITVITEMLDELFSGGTPGGAGH